MNVLSLFDGISCGQIALQRAGIYLDKYYASEIDKNAIKITQHNYPNTIQLGDITQIDFTQFVDKINLLIGGSPCQDLSIAGSRKGLKGVRSKLFYDFVEALNAIEPQFFLFENNSSMSQDNKNEITKILKCEPIEINSKLVSAQHRKRLYWTNIPNVHQPIDKNIKLQDILEYGYADRDKSLCIARRYAGFQGSQSYLCRRYFGKSFGQGIFTNKEDKEFIKKLWKQNPRFTDEELSHKIIRPLTCIECERLQTLPDNYTSCIQSDNIRKELIGNGWTVDVISHILKNIAM